MKIQIDDIVRDMTAEEESAFNYEHENAENPEESAQSKAEAYDILMGVSE